MVPILAVCWQSQFGQLTIVRCRATIDTETLHEPSILQHLISGGMTYLGSCKIHSINRIKPAYSPFPCHLPCFCPLGSPLLGLLSIKLTRKILTGLTCNALEVLAPKGSRYRNKIYLGPKKGGRMLQRCFGAQVYIYHTCIQAL